MAETLRSLPRLVLAGLSSLKLSVVCLGLLLILTFLGTLDQVENGLVAAQHKYFESVFLFQELFQVGSFTVRVLLPGANLVLWVLGVNLVLGGIVRLKWDWRRAGILVGHLGIVFLLVSGMVKHFVADSGFVRLYESDQIHRVVGGEASSKYYQDFHQWEIAVTEARGDGFREHLFHADHFTDAGEGPVTLASPALPFDLEVRHWMLNAEVHRVGPMLEPDVPAVDGWFLHQLEPQKEYASNLPGCYVRVPGADGDGTGILWILARQPWTVTVEGVDYAVDLRRVRRELPFELTLDDFVKIEHPGTSRPKEFSSYVTVRDEGGSRKVHITMNRPLRSEGLVVYQASWGPERGAPDRPLFSQFEVSNNPADRWPEIACYVIAVGLLLHFGSKLVRFVDSQMARRA